MNELSIDFPSGSDYVDLPAPSVLTGSYTQFTWLGWIKLENTTRPTVWGLGGPDYELLIRVFSGEDIMVAFNGTLGQKRTNNSEPLSQDIWHFVDIRYDGSLSLSSPDSPNNRCVIRVDGNIPAQINFGANPPTSTNSHDGSVNSIGAHASEPAAGGTTAAVRLNNIMFFNRRLTDTEVSGAAPGNLPADPTGIPNLVGWWRCGEGDFSPDVFDSSGNGYHGTMVNMDNTNIISDAPP